MKHLTRCEWPGDDALYVAYHDTEWGVPEYDPKALFAKLILDGAQAGLSWITILRKRSNYYEAFDDLDPEKMALYDDRKVLQLRNNPGIVRNRLKINAAITNAQAYLDLESGGTSFTDFIWSFTDGRVIQNSFKSMEEVPVTTPESEAMSKALKKHGFKFVGPTICYAYMQAVGIVNDHLTHCFRHADLGGVK